MTSLKLTINRQDTILQNLKLWEKVDLNILKYMIKNGTKIFKDNENNDIPSYYKKIKKSGEMKGLKEVIYKKIGRSKNGRVYAKDNLSLGGMRKILRHELSKDYYMDIDIVNAHPVMLSQICNTNMIVCNSLMEYIHNRDKHLKDLMDLTGKERGICKVLFISMINGGTSNGWKINNNIIDTDLPPFIKEYETEMGMIGQRIFDSNVEFRKGLKEKKNEVGHVMAMYLQEYENRILEVIYSFLNMNGFIDMNIATLCWDGIMIKQTDDPNLMTSLNMEVLIKVGFNLEFKEKIMDKRIDRDGLEDYKDEMENIMEEYEDSEIEKELMEEMEKYLKNNKVGNHQKRNFDFNFKKWICYRFKQTNYDVMKKYFEKFYLYFDNDNALYRIKHNRVVSYTSKPNHNLEFDVEPIKTDRGLGRWLYLKYFKSVPNTEEGRENNKKLIDKCDNIDEQDKWLHLYMEDSFLNRWYEDKERTSFTDLVFEPNREDNNPNEYNVFNGFAYKKLKTRDIKKMKYKKMFQEYLDYIKKYNCNGSQEIYDFYMSHLAHIIQYPHIKNEICYIFYSRRKGTNKSSTINFVNEMIGERYTFTGNGREILDKHSTTCNFALTNTLEELSNKISTPEYERIKDYIQRKKNLINEKFKNIKKNNDYVRYFITTNERSSIGLDSDNRRFVCLTFIRADEGTEEYERIRLLLKDVFGKYKNEMKKMFGEYLEKWEIEINPYIPLDWNLASKSSDDIKLFYKIKQIDTILLNIYNNQYGLKHWIDEKNIKKDKLRMKLRVLYEQYEEIVDNRQKYSKENFNKNLEEHKKIVKITRPGNSPTITISLKKLHKYLKKNNLTENEYENYYIKEDDTEEIDESDDETILEIDEEI